MPPQSPTEKYIDTRLASMEKYIDTRLAAEDKARTLEDKAIGEKLERACEDIRDLQQYRFNQEGMASQKSVTAATMLAAASLFLAVLSLVLRFMGV